MDIPFKNQVDRFRALPRTWQVIGLLALLLLAWFACSDTVWKWAGEYGKEAAKLEALLDAGRDDTNQVTSSLRAAVIAYGPAQVPRDRAAGAAALAQATNGIIGKHPAVSNYSYAAHTGGKLPASALRDVIGEKERAERAQGEVQFTASFEEVAKIIEELERSPEIDAINTVRLVRNDANKKLKVTLLVEAWVIAAPSATGSGAAGSRGPA